MASTAGTWTSTSTSTSTSTATPTPLSLPTSSASGGLFKSGSIFGGSSSSKAHVSTRRPSTSGGSPTYTSNDSVFQTTSSTARPSAFSRKASLSSSSTSKSPKTHRARNHSITAFVNFSPERRTNTSTSTATPSQYQNPNNIDSRPGPSTAQGPTHLEESEPKSVDNFRQAGQTAETIQIAQTAPPSVSPPSRTDSWSSTTPYINMLARPGTSYQSINPNGPPSFAPAQPPSPSLETITYQHIQETSSKRISTLDYLRKSHEGRVYWFNTLLFNKPDLQRMPYFDTRKLARRATNYLLLGLSLPTIIDLNSSNPMEFLKTLNALLAEFESFQQMHPPDGSPSSLSRGRFPQMFKRATTASGKGRRTSSAAEIGLPMGNDSFDSKSTNGSITSVSANSTTTFSTSEIDLLPGEEYTYLLTPSLPFDPDFYETFATLCDVLIDCYTRLMSLVSSPRECSPTVAEMFTKADARVRKIIVQGVVKEFEDSSRAGVKIEVAGVSKVVLGGLM